MKDARQAKLAFVTQPAPGIYHLNLRAENEDFFRLQITKEQLSNMVLDGAAIVLRTEGEGK